MELLPEMKLGWLNGWLLLALLYGVFGVLLWLFPRSVVRRLYDRSGWTRRDYAMRLLALPLALTYFGLMIFLPLQIGEPAFVVGLLVYTLGLTGFVTALLTYRQTPLDKPVSGGLYRFSRNPQALTLLISFLGAGIAVGSWLVVAIVASMALLMHTRILAEERACLAQYGEAYRDYMEQVPRYFLVA